MIPVMQYWLLIFSIFAQVLFTTSNGNMTRDECLAIERTNSFRTSSKVVNVHEGNPAYLHCSTPHSSDNLVAWTRLTDNALLTADGQTFSTDARFQVSPKRNARDWVLIIRRVQFADSGCYLCEINTEPMSTLFPVYLNVLPTHPGDDKASVSQKQSTRLNSQLEGSTLLLNCTVEMPDVLAPDIIWTKDSKPIDIHDGTKYKSDYKIVGSTIIYILRIASASSQDDGQYACEGENLPKSAQMVYVNANSSKVNVNALNTLLLISIWFLHSK